MKVVKVGGKSFEVPKYVSRVEGKYAHGWQVRYGGASKFFSDGKSAAESLAAAKEHLDKVFDPDSVKVCRSRRTRTSESETPVGIRLVKKDAKCGTEYYLVVQAGRGTSRNIYVGTERTWARNYDEKMALAQQARAELLTELVSSKMDANKAFKKSLEN